MISGRCCGCPVLRRLFGDALNDEQIAELGCIFQGRQVRRNTVLYQHGDSAGQVYALHSGSVKIVRALEDGRARISRLVKTGEMFGLEAIGTAPVYPTTATVAAGGTVCVASRDAFRELFRSRSDIAESLVRCLLEELDQTRQEMSCMSLKNARARLAMYLVSLLPGNESGDEPSPRLKLGLSRQEIGELLDLGQETVSRAFSYLQNEGILTVHGRRLEVHDVEKLRRVYES